MHQKLQILMTIRYILKITTYAAYLKTTIRQTVPGLKACKPKDSLTDYLIFQTLSNNKTRLRMYLHKALPSQVYHLEYFHLNSPQYSKRKQKYSTLRFSSSIRVQVLIESCVRMIFCDKTLKFLINQQYAQVMFCLGFRVYR